MYWVLEQGDEGPFKGTGLTDCTEGRVQAGIWLAQWNMAIAISALGRVSAPPDRSLWGQHGPIWACAQRPLLQDT